MNWSMLPLMGKKKTTRGNKIKGKDRRRLRRGGGGKTNDCHREKSTWL